MSVSDRKLSGIVFNIQKYSVHDGPGIRTVVFLKGCPLHCLWCSNPESQHSGPELAYNREKCLTLDCCIRCVEVCKTGAIVRDGDNRVRVERRLCDGCLDCTGVCPPRALNFYGEEKTVDQVVSAVEEDGLFYSRSGGGITLSGGEPMHQPEFAAAILREAKRRRIHTAMETCGHCGQEDLKAACRALDVLLYDIKTMDPQRHRELTGVSNERILENLTKARAEFADLPILIRTPVVPGVNDRIEEIGRILDLIRHMPETTYEMLPYHRMGKPKYEYLGGTFPMGEKTLEEETFRQLCEFVRGELKERFVHHR
jgi:pyruvate formate lyase activating enzyme